MGVLTGYARKLALMSNVISLTGNIPHGEPNQDIIEDLERLLEEAKSGELRGLVYGVVRKNGHLGNGFSASGDEIIKLVASAALASHRLNNYAQCPLTDYDED